MDLIAFKSPSRAALRSVVLATLATAALGIPTLASAAPGRDARPAASHSSSYRAAPVRSVGTYHRASYPRYGYSNWRPGYLGVGYRGYRGGYYGSRYWYGWGPAIGLTIPLLPLGYTSLWVGGTPYYYANNVYYVRSVDGYRVVEPPMVDDVTWHDTPREPASGGFSAPTPSYAKPAPAPAPTDELSITPRNNQSATQRSFDRIDCERAAITQTGYDPSAGGEALRKAEYVRNVSACLEGKGYTVK
ncbi:MAG: hypothetical protein JNN20_08315 [Betaproteobacteria bacterium]|nr:hypothetical protein [Betaproteobacteria bacterium]